MTHALPVSRLLGALWLAGCGVGDLVELGDTAVPGADAETPWTAPDVDAGSDAGSDAATGSDGTAPECRVLAGPMTGKRDCTRADGDRSFSPPQQKWRFDGGSAGPLFNASAVPLVAQLDDDNADGRIDRCDTPDVLVVAHAPDAPVAQLLLLSGATGAVQRTLPVEVLAGVQPAIGDVDGDGRPDILALDAARRLNIIAGDGSEVRVGAVAPEPAFLGTSGCEAITLADLEGDGRPEILTGYAVFEATGALRFGDVGTPLQPFPPSKVPCVIPTAVDMEGDGQLEVYLGTGLSDLVGNRLWAAAYDHGYAHPVQLPATTGSRLLLSMVNLVQILDIDGGGTLLDALCGGYPMMVSDLRGDGVDHVVDGSCGMAAYPVATAQPSPAWASTSPALSGAVAAFDFLGRGIADVVVTVAGATYFLDGADGSSRGFFNAGIDGGLLTPVIADVDADGSADVLVWDEHDLGYSLVALQARDRDWAPARSLWNQHLYLPETVGDDGRISKTFPAGPWIRRNLRLQDGDACLPAP